MAQVMIHRTEIREALHELLRKAKVDEEPEMIEAIHEVLDIITTTELRAPGDDKKLSLAGTISSVVRHTMYIVAKAESGHYLNRKKRREQLKNGTASGKLML